MHHRLLSSLHLVGACRVLSHICNCLQMISYLIWHNLGHHNCWSHLQHNLQQCHPFSLPVTAAKCLTQTWTSTMLMAFTRCSVTMITKCTRRRETTHLTSLSFTAVDLYGTQPTGQLSSSNWAALIDP